MGAPCSQWIACSPVRKGSAGRPVTRIVRLRMNRRRVAAGVFLAAYAAWMVGGLFMFGVGGVRRCDRGGLAEYCDKFGAPRTKEEFERHEIWSIGAVSGVFLLIPVGWWWKRSDDNDSDART